MVWARGLFGNEALGEEAVVLVITFHETTAKNAGFYMTPAL